MNVEKISINFKDICANLGYACINIENYVIFLRRHDTPRT